MPYLLSRHRREEKGHLIELIRIKFLSLNHLDNDSILMGLYHTAEFGRPNSDGRINKNWMARYFDQTAKTGRPKMTIRPNKKYSKYLLSSTQLLHSFILTCRDILGRYFNRSFFGLMV